MIEKLDNVLDQISKWGVILCVFLMLTLSVAVIVLRQFEITFLWIEPLVRHLVFLSTFFGGALATGNAEHIKIDILSRFLEKSNNVFLKNLVQRIVLLATAVAVYILLNSSMELMELEFEGNQVGFFDIPTGYLLGIIPVGMSLILLRIIVKFLKTFTVKAV